jgi:hypothetical protein
MALTLSVIVCAHNEARYQALRRTIAATYGAHSMNSGSDLRAHDPADEMFTAAVCRARAEFLEMPGLKLTPAQAQRLWALDRALCDAVLAALVDAHFLVPSGHASFVRAD